MYLIFSAECRTAAAFLRYSIILCLCIPVIALASRYREQLWYTLVKRSARGHRLDAIEKESMLSKAALPAGLLVFNLLRRFTGAYVARVGMPLLYRLLFLFAAIVWELCRNRGSFWTYIRLGMPKTELLCACISFFLQNAGGCSVF